MFWTDGSDPEGPVQDRKGLLLKRLDDAVERIGYGGGPENIRDPHGDQSTPKLSEPLRRIPGSTPEICVRMSWEQLLVRNSFCSLCDA